MFNRSEINWANRSNVIVCKLCTMILEKRYAWDNVCCYFVEQFEIVKMLFLPCSRIRWLKHWQYIGSFRNTSAEFLQFSIISILFSKSELLPWTPCKVVALVFVNINWGYAIAKNNHTSKHIYFNVFCNAGKIIFSTSYLFY